MKFVDFLGYEAYKNLKCLKKNQPIIITGVSGSGITESGKHILDFLCQVKSDSQNVAAVPIFDAFGNARTRANSNSSRYCKLVEVLLVLTLFYRTYENCIEFTHNVVCVCVSAFAHNIMFTFGGKWLC